MDLKKFQGALIGTFVGDALGMPIEGMTNADIIATHGGPLREMEGSDLRDMAPGTYTDDTQLMIGLAEGLVEAGGVDCSVIAARFVDNLDLRRGYGPGTIKVLNTLRTGCSWDGPARAVFGGEGSLGNGAPMRIAPIGCAFYDALDRIRQAAEDCSRITHAHPLGIEGGVVQALAVALAVGTEPEEGIGPLDLLGTLSAMTNEAEYLKRFKRIEELLGRGPPPEVPDVVKALGNDVRAYTSVPASIYSFLRYPGSFEEAVVFAVNLGGDTDTIGAMTGAIAGGLHGIDGIPRRWLDVLENEGKGRDHVLELAEGLWEATAEGRFRS